MNLENLLKKLMIFLLSAVCLTYGRPSNLLTNQELSNDIDSKLTQLQSYYPYQDNQPMDKLLLLYMYPDSSSSLYKDNEYRAPESKRQVRYRQCYFNPISCFRK